MTRELSDTSPDIASRQRAALAGLSGAERLRMACDMFETARTLVLSSLPVEVRNDPVESRVRLLERFYGRDLEPSFLERVASLIRRDRPLGRPPTAGRKYCCPVTEPPEKA